MTSPALSTGTITTGCSYTFGKVPNLKLNLIKYLRVLIIVSANVLST